MNNKVKCKSCGKIIKVTEVFCNECLKKIFGESRVNYSPPLSGGFTAGIKDKDTFPNQIIFASDSISIDDTQKISLKGNSLITGGDEWEQKYYKFISKDFPNYERFWQTFILPRRREGKIRLKSTISKIDEYICMCNYTIFRKLVSAKSKISKAMISDTDSEEEIDTCIEGYLYLGSALDLVYKFLMTIGLKYIGNKKPDKLTEEELIEMVIKYYQKNYNSDYEDFIKNQKYISINIHSSASFIKEVFREYNTPNFGKQFSRLFEIRDLVVRYRNPFVHNPIIGNIQGKIPKKKYIKEFLNWSQVEEIVDKPGIIKEKFTDIVSELENDFKGTLIILNNIWGILIDKIFKNKKEF